MNQHQALGEKPIKQTRQMGGQRTSQLRGMRGQELCEAHRDRRPRLGRGQDSGDENEICKMGMVALLFGFTESCDIWMFWKTMYRNYEQQLLADEWNMFCHASVVALCHIVSVSD